MIPKQRRKLLATGFCFAMFLLLACNGTNNGQQKTSDSTTSTNHPHTDTLLSDNEVKAEAPDANIKTEQGYALPRHSANLANHPLISFPVKQRKPRRNQFHLSFIQISMLQKISGTLLNLNSKKEAHAL